MKAYVLKKFGKPEVLKIQEVEEPVLKEDTDVKVKVQAIGLNYAEVLSRKGQYRWAPKRPYTLGMEAVGIVEEVGSAVSHVNVGDQVIVGGQTGSYAEKVVASSHLVFPAISKFSLEENAAFMVNFVTAWVGLVQLAKAKPEEKVLIHAAAGGVGTAAVQIMAAKGATVIGTAGSDEKLKLIKDLGAHEAINYRKDDFYEVVKEKYGGVDVVLEVVGADVYRKSLELLNSFGRVAIAGFASISIKPWNPFSYIKTWMDAPKVNLMNLAKKSYGVFATHIGYLTANKQLTGEVWKDMSEFVEENGLKPVVGKTFEFKDLPEAHKYMESRQSVGKIVILMPS
ncbi:MAG: NADPH:quinone oxidoreductase family protein [bacterium]|nr:NADPH:quinone oxidoreductase family protein [bacterium]